MRGTAERTHEYQLYQDGRCAGPTSAGNRHLAACDYPWYGTIPRAAAERCTLCVVLTLRNGNVASSNVCSWYLGWKQKLLIAAYILLHNPRAPHKRGRSVVHFLTYAAGNLGGRKSCCTRQTPCCITHAAQTAMWHRPPPCWAAPCAQRQAAQGHPAWPHCTRALDKCHAPCGLLRRREGR